MKKESKWYVIRSQGNKERKVSDRIKKDSEDGKLKNIVDNIIVPTETTLHAKDGKKIKREKVLFPGYIFIKTKSIGELKFYLKGCDGAIGFLTERNGDIKPMSQAEIDRMLGVQEEKNKEADAPYIEGQEVKVIDGAFSSMVGIIDNISGKKIKVNVSIFGRLNPVILSPEQITKVD